MKSIYRLGIDLAKQNFELCGVDETGRVIFRRTLKRAKLSEFMVNLPKTRVFMEACASSHYWARKFKHLGHEVGLIPAQFVKPFLKSQKNDRNDALAIVEAGLRPTMSFVSIKQPWQQDLQSVHRVRSRIVKNLVEINNQIHGLLGEYGVLVKAGVKGFKRQVQEILETPNEDLTDAMRALLSELWVEYLELERRKQFYTDKIETLSRADSSCQKLEALPGVGPMTATAFITHIGNPQDYKNGRQAAASLGLVPRQHSSGGRVQLLGITKRGDKYLRSLLIHGARAYVSAIKRRPISELSPYEEKVRRMLEKKHMNVVVVAVANRNARVMLTMLKTKECYRGAA